jgi:DNA-binding phage protein
MPTWMAGQARHEASERVRPIFSTIARAKGMTQIANRTELQAIGLALVDLAGMVMR